MTTMAGVENAFSSEPASPRRVRANALTVDVEEWFHICGPAS